MIDMFHVSLSHRVQISFVALNQMICKLLNISMKNSCMRSSKILAQISLLKMNPAYAIVCFPPFGCTYSMIKVLLLSFSVGEDAQTTKEDVQTEQKIPKLNLAVDPRFDKFDHWVEFDDFQSGTRCKYLKCRKTVHTFC